MVTLVVTTGSGAMDIYAQKLAEKLDVPKIYTDIYQRIRESFNILWLSKEALKAIPKDWDFIKRLHKLKGIVHLPNQHLGRYGNFLKMPYIITVHDLIRYFDLKGYGTYIHRPNFRDKFYLNLDYKGIRKAARIIAVSQATKRDLMRHLGIPDEQISVVHLGVDHSTFRPSFQANESEYPYILFVGSEHPRKNLPTLLRAFKRLKEQASFKNLKLVKVGKAGGGEADFRGQTMEIINSLNLDGEVIFTDFISEESLRAYYCDARCLVFPSLYEGFGLPPLEAMACGCPVVISNSSSLPEVVGEAAIKVSPRDVEGLIFALERVLTNQELRKNLTREGKKQAAKFSWEQTAEKTLKVYKEVEESFRV
jgi:glycosyltransferase involved in cell wall biosynthesis